MKTNIYKKINEWDEKCPKCGIMTYFMKEEQHRNWVGQCVKCALLSGEFELPKDQPKWVNDLILIKHELRKKGRKIVKVNKDHGSN